MRTTLLERPPASVPMIVAYRPGGPLMPVRTAIATVELEPVGYLRVFRRPNGTFLHVARWDVLSVDGVPQ